MRDSRCFAICMYPLPSACKRHKCLAGDPFAKRNSVQRAPFKSKASFKAIVWGLTSVAVCSFGIALRQQSWTGAAVVSWQEKKQPRDSPDSLDDEGLATRGCRETFANHLLAGDVVPAASNASRKDRRQSRCYRHVG